MCGDIRSLWETRVILNPPRQRVMGKSEACRPSVKDWKRRRDSQSGVKRLNGGEEQKPKDVKRQWRLA